LFQPVLRLREKAHTDRRTIRRWDSAQTPFERVLATGVLREQQRTRLEELRATINPRQLRRTIERDLEQLLPQPVGGLLWEWAA